ncbi:calcium-binding protein [Cognatishimia sp. F0-27]|uniref:calcium-binding protein n=1 Tax=Cognatishimia sp. F0-27 TaxID=2816855 RepID=UPI001D0C9A81|nr:calcium-binding protein [Cognatishimia sp. F0-27]MCC1495061.1 hypothetical protein [Cognatishimia sp. F0-27]
MPVLSASSPIFSIEGGPLDATQHSTTALAGGGFAAVWRAVTGFGFTEAEINARSFDADGTPVGMGVERVFMPDNLFTADLPTDIAGLADGSALFVFDSQQGPPHDAEGIFGQYLTPQGEAGIGANFVTGEFGVAETDPAVAVLSNGNFVYAYEQLGDVQVVVRSTENRTIVAPQTVNVFTTAAQQNPDVTALPDGGFAVTWQSFNQQGQENEILVRFFDAAGAPGREFFVNRTLRGDQTEPVITALDNGDVAVAFLSESDVENVVRAAQITPEGRLVGFENFVSDELVPAGAGGPAITALDGGGYAVAYEYVRAGAPSGIAVRSYDDNSRPLGPSDVIPNNGVTFLGEPEIVQLENGEILVSWEGTSSGPSGQDIFGQTYVLSTPGEVLNGDGRPNALTGGAGDDTITGRGGNDTLRGEGGNDTIDAGAGFDDVAGGAGNDTLVGSNGFDTLRGNDGADLLQGNFGNDFMLGGAGNDRLEGGLGFDAMAGDDGNDFLQARDGFDTLEGGAGDDTLQGNNGNDNLQGDAGNDRLEGGLGADTMAGGLGNDTLLGANGFDLLIGGDGDDRLEGNSGNDTMRGNEGNDAMRGGVGADTFVYTAGADRIVDFQNNIDAIQIAASLLDEAMPVPEDLRGYARLTGDGDLQLNFGDGNTLTFNGVNNTGAILDDVIFI